MLVKNGSVYDLAAMYIVLINKAPIDKDNQKILMQQLINALNNGYTYIDIYREILNSFHNHVDFPFYKFNQTNKGDANLLTQGAMYYHKELKIINSLPVINHDIDSGTMTSDKIEYYLEPKASYTMKELLEYFYSKNMTDIQEYPHKRMAGVFRHLIGKYGLDKLLFMIEAASRMYDTEYKVFNIADFESYSSTASRYLEEIKNNCKYSGGDKYVTRKRVLFK